MAIPNAKRILADSIEFATEAKSALKGADCCILMTEREEFGKLTEEDYLSHMRAPNPLWTREESTTLPVSRIPVLQPIELGRSS